MHHQNVDLEIQQNNLLLVGSKKGVDICQNPLGLQKNTKGGLPHTCNLSNLKIHNILLLFAKSYTALKCAQ